MARNNYFPPSAGGNEDSADDNRRREFGERLRVRMNQRDWSQSDLARQAGLKRDAISTYLSGKRWPSPANMKKLATALQTTTADLVPSIAYVAPAVPPLEVSQQGDEMNLRINQRVSMSKAIRILAILGEAETAATPTKAKKTPSHS